MHVEGINFFTIFALFAGLIAHALKQLIMARKLKAGVTAREYALGHWPEGLLAALSAAVLYLGLPELAGMFPDFAGTLGFGPKQTVISSFVAGYMANSLADFLGGRARSIAGGAPPEAPGP